ncbi:MAG: beta-propeller fold lactonase family protein [Lutibacter sp.]|uniref:lactonase family protein n=1 Tax=Lutibacter sp. TaxID=1925666 RepID=UPI0019E3C9C5|nr:lactonase family protein [Lutibacter sp.]NOR28893.1 beta-propeller fold lactonase family protein [Lutibacter sp.]
MKQLFNTLFLVVGITTCAQNIPLYLGTYTDEKSEGIYYYNFNTKTGEISDQKLVATLNNPSFLSYSSNRKFLYAVSEVNNFSNTNSGFVSAFSVVKNGELQFINSVSSNGAHPCHIEVNSKNVAISNYSGGTISIHKIGGNGEIKPANQILNHNTVKKKSHAHSTQFFKNDLFVADLGRNFLAHYSKEDSNFVLNENYLMGKKSGPRHFKITKNGNFIYVINEYSSTISVLKNSKHQYKKIQNISTLDTNFKDENSCADIHLSNDENYVYGSNRGENSMVVFKRNAINGTLKKIQTISVEGDWPRNFTIAPNGQFLLVANQKSKNISVYKVASKTGKLSYLQSVQVPTPVCLLF